MPRLLPCLVPFAFAATPSAQDDWWAYRPLQRPAVPAVADAAWPQNPIDHFVRHGLERRGLTPAPAADRHTLLRRVTYDLTGLPPTPAEIDAFVADASPDAYERVVDRLLASPQHGVKWAQHWLDVVRYAETDGYERDRKKPFVWRYRDWVVDACNQDLPYGRFLRAQLAGDELPGATVADLVATGYYRLGIWDDEPTDREQHRYDDLDGIADTTARSMLAISIGCARCHDHKKDPLPQRDYYAFLACFENIAPYDLEARVVPIDGARERFEQATATYAAERARLLARLREVAAAATLAPAPRGDFGLVAHYGGEGGSAARIVDDVGGHHGRGEGQLVVVPGRRGQALRADGDDAFLVPRLVQDSFSVTFWVRADRGGHGPTGGTQWHQGLGLVDGEVPGVARDWGITWFADGRVLAGVGDPDTSIVSPPGYDDGEWHHVAFTRDRDSGRLALHLDGVLVGEATGNRELLDAPASLAVARLSTGGRHFRGDLDEISFFDRALSPAEVCCLGQDLPQGLAAAPALAAAPELAALQRLQPPTLATVEVLAVRENGPLPPPSFVRQRGNVHTPGAAVEPGVPGLLGAIRLPAATPTTNSSGRRSALAAWITDHGNPLTWRVIVNRLWQHHFGRGLVRSSNDFGRLGDLPTHPELLDWLACELIARGESLKSMHRLLVTSATYRMACSSDAGGLAADPLGDSLWRFERRRLTGEEVRDSMLMVTGELQTGLGGPSVFPPMPAQVLATSSRPDEAWGEATAAEAARRSLYIHVKRSLPEPLLAAFDRADTDTSCPVRFATVQPTQALTLLNGEFAHRMATRFAVRLAAEARDLRSQLTRGLELVTQRPARAADVERLLALATDLRRDHGRDEATALQRCCLVLLNGNEFLYLD
ncbi:MAG: DUF1553 domain-containing protein [Planctomycetes bacterium]|nr:DUF1553 domain-containing protein [Planctomycetota bacterium]